MSETVLDLPKALRSELKDPLGPIYTDAELLLQDASTPLVTVGDVVTYHLRQAGYTPTVALIDEKTKRRDVDPEIRQGIAGEGFDHEVEVANPAATLTGELLQTLRDALANQGETTLVRVDGEEDLAALPAVLAVPDGASVVYGQPDEGMVLVTTDAETRAWVRTFIERMDGDVDAALELLA